MYVLLLFAELVIAVAMVVFVLLQRSEGGALGMGGGGGMGGLFSPRGAADTLTRTTSILGALFFVACIGLNLMAKQPTQSGAEQLLSTPSNVPVRAPAQPAGPQVPKPQ